MVKRFITYRLRDHAYCWHRDIVVEESIFWSAMLLTTAIVFLVRDSMPQLFAGERPARLRRCRTMARDSAALLPLSLRGLRAGFSCQSVWWNSRPTRWCRYAVNTLLGPPWHSRQLSLRCWSSSPTGLYDFLTHLLLPNKASCDVAERAEPTR